MQLLYLAVMVYECLIFVLYVAEVDKMSKFIKQAKATDTHVVDEAFLDSAEKGGAALFIKQHSIASWGADVSVVVILCDGGVERLN